MRTSQKTLNSDKNLQAYVIGLAIGDGNLSNPNSRATRLRITCDKKYPLLLKRITVSLKKLLPDNKVHLVHRDNCIDVSVYSNHLEKLLGWSVGSKFSQNVTLPQWINRNKKYKTECLRGLIETDGAIYLDRGYKMVIFSNIIEKLSRDVYDAITSLGFEPRFYKVLQKPKNNFKYQVRLSKKVDKFLSLVNPQKH